MTPAALTRLETLRAKQGKSSLFLRITVDGGGCQGFEYQFSFADEPVEGDLSLANGLVGAVTDPDSYELIQGATLDYEDELIGAKFVIKNPNATSSCGCGTSFNIA